MTRKKGRPKVAGLGYHSNLGQYRKTINGRSIYFGSDPEQALARYQLFSETGSLWERSYRQFCIERDGQIIRLGPTIEAARRNFATYSSQSTPTRQSVSLGELAVNTVKEVGNGYIHWLIRNGKNPGYIQEVTRSFHEIMALPQCGNRQLDELDLAYFKS